MFPYKIQLVQELKPTDYAQRMDYVISLLEKQDQSTDFIHNLIMSDEAHFELNGFVNKQNCRIWATENPRAVHQQQLHPLKCTVWCGISSERIIGPYFFENEAGNAITINAAQYRAMLENFLRPAVENHPQLWFQQGGATAHTARETMALLRDIFGERIISRNMRLTENIAAVAQSVREQPSTSTRHRSQELNISRTSLRRILHKDLGMNAYKVQLVQELKPHDHPMRFRFAQWAEDRLIEDEHFYRKIIFSDEAHFHLGGYVNKQNCRIWGSENPHVIVEKPMHPQRVTVWCGFWSGGIIGPFFFENEQGNAVTVNGDRYRAMLSDFLFPKIEEDDIDDIWFQQDGATNQDSKRMAKRLGEKRRQALRLRQKRVNKAKKHRAGVKSRMSRDESIAPESPEVVIEDSDSGESGEGMEVETSDSRGEEPIRHSGPSRTTETGKGRDKEEPKRRTLAIKLEDREVTKDTGNYIFDQFFKRSLRAGRVFSLLRWGIKGGGVLFTTKCERTMKMMEESGMKFRSSRVMRCQIEDLDKRHVVTMWCSHSTMLFKDLKEAVQIEYPALGAEDWILWKEADPEDKGREFSVKMRPRSAQHLRRWNGKFRLCGGVIRVVCKIM
ncbi:hypothetical protein WN55_08618 [Dufourea novaeangliae]|uniref:Uncharacterized protein n=1 Tax=Dufourea novaeangliae TaxID=178035 RepID=A0A154PSY0_DUFNO|nr:hypothetical protein WN55_08618 [Dufourea novaeangliae]